jgi:insertion element IS1 protein InsB
VAFYWFKKRKLWVINTIDRNTRRTMVWVLGDRDSATFGRLYEKVTHLENCIFLLITGMLSPRFYPRDVIYIIGKAHTIDIGHDNSNAHHHLGRFTRRTKVVSRSELMVELTLRIWHVVTTTDLFLRLQQSLLTIF